ncbi:MAG: thioesterase family protein [Rubripirellula sp.]|nr:thioesterase family protein [Rubripirellula sp.]
MVFRTQRRVEFRDTDAAGITHFSAFFPMMEAAEHEMLRSLGISVMPRKGNQDAAALVTWPRVAANCQYKATARFEDLLEILVSIKKLGNSSVTYQFRFERGGELIAEGEITAVCCHLNRDHTDGGLQKIPIPAKVRESLESL